MSYTTLVDTESLNHHLHDPGWIVLDCRFTLTDTEAGRRDYEESHIPGTRYAHLDNDMAAPVTVDSGRHPLPAVEVLAKKLGEWGIDNSKQVVVYDDAFGSMACRMWWLLRWFGHDNVALLDGVLPKWIREKRPLTRDRPDVTPATFIPHVRDALWVDANAAKAAADDIDKALIDARSEERFTGEVEPLDKVAGHVPGAISNPYDENLDIGGDLMSVDALQELYNDLLADVKPENVIHMCGSGVTACHNVLAMEVAGMKGSRLYAGSWSEWITDGARSIATGEG